MSRIGEYTSNRYLLVIALSFLMLVTGCSFSRKMAFEGDTETIKSGTALYLMAVTIYGSHPQELTRIYMRKKGGGDYIGQSGPVFDIDEKARYKRTELGNYKRYFIRLELEKGEYGISVLYLNYTYTIYGVGSYISSSFIRLDPVLDIKSSGNGVFYLGHLTMTLNQKEGTVNVRINDEYEKDKADFRWKFPVLNRMIIKKSILPKYFISKVIKYRAY